MNANTSVIIADDHRLFRIGIKSILSTFDNIEVVAEACDGEELIPLVQQYNPNVVLLDLRMPNMDGFEALDVISQKYKETRVIILSSFNTENYIAHAIEHGAAGYLDKNAEPQEIQVAIQSVVAQKFYFDDKINRAMVNRLVRGKKGKPVLGNNVQLNDSEIGVLTHLCAELTSGEIAQKMYLSQRTIEGIRQELMRKTQSKNVVGLIVFAVKNGLVDLAEAAV